MTIQLEEGKFYRNRYGERVGPLLRREYGLTRHPWVWRYAGGSKIYTEVGANLTDGGHDIVAEWVDPVDETCPAQTAVEGGPLPEPFTHGDAFAGMKSTDIMGLKADIESQAEAAMGLADKLRPWFEPDIKAEIADEAKRIVSGARRSAYGKPEQNFERIAHMWTAYAKAKGWPMEFSAADISPLMILMKLARIVETPDHRDSFVDVVGYSLTGAEVNGVKPA